MGENGHAAQIQSPPVVVRLPDFEWEVITGQAGDGTMVKLLRATHPSGGVVVELLMDFEHSAKKMGASLQKPPIITPGLEVVAP